MLLQREPNQKASQLAEELGVSVRTLHRYINMLEEIGIPIYSERGPHGGFSLVRGYKMPPLVLTPEEAVSVYLGTSLVEEMWGALYSEPAKGALAKIDNLLPDDQRKEVAWARSSLVATGMHRSDFSSISPILESIRRAAREKRRVAILYRGRSQSEPIYREVDTYALIHRWGWWYGIGFCHLRQAIRSFRIDRILEISTLEDCFEIIENFKIQDYLETEPHIQPQMHIIMRFFPEAALFAFDDRAYWESLDEQKDGSVIVSFRTPNEEWAVRTVLNYGSSVDVLEPVELRQTIHENALSIAVHYEE
jgi:predicted DNA-binding transcriptional regulator YafY